MCTRYHDISVFQLAHSPRALMASGIFLFLIFSNFVFIFIHIPLSERSRTSPQYFETNVSTPSDSRSLSRRRRFWLKVPSRLRNSIHLIFQLLCVSFNSFNTILFLNTTLAIRTDLSKTISRPLWFERYVSVHNSLSEYVK